MGPIGTTEVCGQTAEACREGDIVSPQGELLERVLNSEGLISFGCMDWDYVWRQRHEVRRVCGVRKCDVVTHAGCVHGLSEPRRVSGMSHEDILKFYSASRVIAEHSIRLAIAKRGIKRVLLSTHRNCGHMELEGYRFQDHAEEEELHRQHRKEAANWIHGFFPDLEILTCFSFLDERGWVQIKDFCKEEFELTPIRT